MRYAESHKAVFLDRDGTINTEKNYLYKVNDFEFLQGVFKALQILQKAEYRIIIITNQSGIARGYYTEREFNELTRWMNEELLKHGIYVDAVYYCPHLPGAPIKKYDKECDCRKPGLGLFRRAIEEYELDISQCYAIGDKIRDVSICAKTDCRGFLIANNEEKTIIEAVRNGKYRQVRYADDLYAAAELIVQENSQEQIRLRENE